MRMTQIVVLSGLLASLWSVGQGVKGADLDAPLSPREFREAWNVMTDNFDWPSTPGFPSSVQ